MSAHGTILPERDAPPPSGKQLAVLTLTALGVVHGDIGTSPLYVRECVNAECGIFPTPALPQTERRTKLPSIWGRSGWSSPVTHG